MENDHPDFNNKRKKKSISGVNESFPISCVSCRRKKIKCNKMKPCNQCIKRSIPCQFPSTFRNIQINEDDLDTSMHDEPPRREDLAHDHSFGSHYPDHKFKVGTEIKLNPDTTIDLSNHYHNHIHGLQSPKSGYDNNDFVASNLRQELDLFRAANIQLIESNNKLQSELSKLKSQVDGQKKDADDHTSKAIDIAGETTEEGEKYYGPQSSSFMIESLKRQKSGSEESNPSQSALHSHSEKPATTDKQHPEKEKDGHHYSDSIIANSSSSFDSKLSFDFDRSHDENNLPRRSSNLVEQSLAKKRLPPLLYALHKLDDPDVSSDSETWADLQKQNFNVLVKLVELFFDNNRYYETFISRSKVFEFLHSYQDIKDMEWENDDDLLLFYMILLLSLQKLTPSEFIELNLIPQSAIRSLNKFKAYLSKNVLYHSFERLRHNLINESIITIQAYILCTEWYFIEQRYEECWSMMFHCCGIAYSIGLHVMGQFRSINSTSKNNDLTDLGLKKGEDKPNSEKGQDDEDEDDEEMDIFRFKVFFALKSLTGQICSILGRPNPISIQVNSIVLKSSPLSSNQSAINMNKNKTQALLKIGLSECLRLSNSMLIENFMIDFTIDDLLNLNKKFEQEIELLEWFISDEYLSDEEEIKDNNQEDILKIDKTNILMDLIVLHINKAKLFEPFVNKFEKIEQYDLIIKNLINSTLKFLELLNYFIENFLNMFVEKYFHFHTRLGGSDMSNSISDNVAKMVKFTKPSVVLQNQHILDANLRQSDEANLANSVQNPNGGNIPQSQGSSDFEHNTEHLTSGSGAGAFLGSAYNHPNSKIKFGKLFRIYFPFLNSSIYQGIIVVFTFLHYKFQDFVNNKDKTDTMINNEFLKLLELNFNSLLNFDRRISGILNSITKLWPSNIAYLMNKVLNHIKQIQERQNRNTETTDRKRRKQDQPYDDGQFSAYDDRDFEQSMALPIQNEQSEQQPLDLNGQFGEETNFEFTQLYGFHLNDPFWITNPENLPHYLSSPSDEVTPRSHSSREMKSSNNRKSSLGPSGNRRSKNETIIKPEPTDPLHQEQIGQNNVNEMFMTGLNSSYGAGWEQGSSNSMTSQSQSQSQHSESRAPESSRVPEPSHVPNPNPQLNHLLQQSQSGQFGQNPVISNTYIFEMPSYGNQQVGGYPQGNPVQTSAFQTGNVSHETTTSYLAEELQRGQNRQRSNASSMKRTSSEEMENPHIYPHSSQRHEK